MFTTQNKANVKFVSRDKRAFFTTLQKRVDAYFTTQARSRYANATMVVKTIALISCYLLPFLAIVVFQVPLLWSLPLWILSGIGMAGVGMSVMHDANHGAYSAKPQVNTWIGYTALNLLGASVPNWKLQHNVLHHTFTNVAHLDEDIEDKALLRFSPHTPVKLVHSLQFIYAFAFYGITSFYWVTFKDFLQFERYIRNKVSNRTPGQNWVIFLRLLGLKVVYFAIALGLPIWVGGLSFGGAFLGFFLMHFVAGIILTVVFQLAHTVEGTSHPLPAECGSIENEWAIHQMNTTVNFSPHNKILSWYCGGLNYQVEHHLFPRICHVHYPKIAPIVRQTAEEFGVPYLENATFSQALRSHIATLQRFGATEPA